MGITLRWSIWTRCCSLARASVLRMSNNETTTATLHDIEDGEIIEENSAADTMTLYEVDVMNLVKPMDLQQRYWFYCHKWHLAALPVDEVYSAIIEEVSQALMPSDEEELFVKTEEEETNFEPVLRRRLNLFGLDCDSLRHLHFRHDRDKAFFNNRLLELAGIRDVLERVSQEDKIYDRIYNDYLECYA